MRSFYSLFRKKSLVAAADTPDGGAVAFQAGGHVLGALPGSDGQHDARMFDLEPGEAPAPGSCLQNGPISAGKGQGAGFSATHQGTSSYEGRSPSVPVT